MGLLRQNAAALIAAVDRGLSFDSIEELEGATGLLITDLANAVGISRTTLRRRRKNNQLTPNESDRLFSVAFTIAQAIELFSRVRYPLLTPGCRPPARPWATSPSYTWRARKLAGKKLKISSVESNTVGSANRIPHFYITRPFQSFAISGRFAVDWVTRSTPFFFKQMP